MIGINIVIAKKLKKKNKNIIEMERYTYYKKEHYLKKYLNKEQKN